MNTDTEPVRPAEERPSPAMEDYRDAIRQFNNIVAESARIIRPRESRWNPIIPRKPPIVSRESFNAAGIPISHVTRESIQRECSESKLRPDIGELEKIAAKLALQSQQATRLAGHLREIERLECIVSIDRLRSELMTWGIIPMWDLDEIFGFEPHYGNDVFANSLHYEDTNLPWFYKKTAYGTIRTFNIPAWFYEPGRNPTCPRWEMEIRRKTHEQFGVGFAHERLQAWHRPPAKTRLEKIARRFQRP